MGGAGVLGNTGEFNATAATKKMQQIKDEEREIPVSKIMLMVVCFVGVLFFNILKGGKTGASPIGVVCGTSAYWFLNLAVVPFTVAISVWVRGYLLQQYQVKCS